MDTLEATQRAKQNTARTPAADRDSHVDPAAPYKANRLSTPRAPEPILNSPGQTTVLTREVLNDMKATSLKDALRSTAGVTVGR
jgi:outer membrane receptor for monomeric catechols